MTRIDLGRAGGGIFCGVAGSGFDSQCAEYAKSVRRLRGPLVYTWSVVRVLARFAPLRATLDHDGGRFEGEVMFISLANTRWFGGGMHIAPHADATDGLLDVVIVHRVSRASPSVGLSARLLGEAPLAPGDLDPAHQPGAPRFRSSFDALWRRRSDRRGAGRGGRRTGSEHSIRARSPSCAAR